MKKYKITLLVIAIALILFGIKKLWFDNFVQNADIATYNYVTSHKKMYCYETYHKGYVNPAIFVMHDNLIDSLRDYYKKVENGNMTPYINFAPLLVPLDTCVYVMGYSKDSTIAQIEFFDKFKYSRFTVKGYVYAHTLHEKRKLHRQP